MSVESKMAELLAGELSREPLKAGDIVEGKIIHFDKNHCLIDIEGYGTGIIPDREVLENFADVEAAIDQMIQASVMEAENEEGHIVLSLRRASREKVWNDVEELMRKGEIVTVVPADANRGGMLIDYSGLKGFLPVSQLSAENYPRVSGGDKEEILSRLRSLVGKEIQARVLDVDRKESKLIFSEKEAMREKTRDIIASIKPGTNVNGLVTGIVDFGIFVNVDGVEGLIHISEIDWDRVLTPADYAEVGKNIEAQVLSVDGDKVSLSLKRLKDDPWLSEIKKYKAGEEVMGKVTRVTPFGAFVDLGKIEALIHVSEINETETNEIKPEDVFEVEREFPFKILLIEPDSRKISLSIKGLKNYEGMWKKQPKKS